MIRLHSVPLVLSLIALGAGPRVDAAAAPEPKTELWVLDAQHLPAPEQTLAATLQGVLNQDRATVWITAQGMSAVVLEQLRAEGATLHEAATP